MANSYNPFQKQGNVNQNIQTQGFFNRSLLNLSIFGNSYDEAAIKNAKGIHKYEDTSQIVDTSGNRYSLFSRKVHALMMERQSIAALNSAYAYKYNILKEYATKGDIRDAVSRLTNEIIVTNKDKKFCELADLDDKWSDLHKKRAKEIFEKVYSLLGFSKTGYAWDLCRDWLVEGYICKEIVRDKKGKDIIGFVTLDVRTIFPYADPESGVKYWIQNPLDNENRRVFLDVEIVYISYSGSSNYMETSYIEPMIKPYNELKTMERTRLLFNLINSMMHKQVTVPVTGMSSVQAENQLLEFISDYKDHIQFDDSTGQIMIDGSKDLPWSKEYFMPENEGISPKVEIINPEGHDLNENSTLIWFKNNFKFSTKFPINRYDSTNGGGNIYSNGADVTHDDYNFSKFVGRCRTIYKEIILQPVIQQMCLEFPELQKDANLANDLDVIYYGNSEIEKAKELSNLQAKAAIAADLTNNFKWSEDRPYFHPRYIAKHVMELTEEQIQENEQLWKEDADAVASGTGNGSTSTTPEASNTTNETETGASEQPATTENETPSTETPAEQTPPTETPPEE